MSTWITRRANDLGLRIIDARQPLELELSRTDITQAIRKNSKDCAFATACKRQFKARAAYFFRTTAWLEYPDKMVRYILPQSMQKEIVSFDRSKIMAPGVYQLSKPTVSDSKKAVNNRNQKRIDRVKAVRRRLAKAATQVRRPIRHRTKFIRTAQEPS